MSNLREKVRKSVRDAVRDAGFRVWSIQVEHAQSVSDVTEALALHVIREILGELSGINELVHNLSVDVSTYADKFHNIREERVYVNFSGASFMDTGGWIMSIVLKVVTTYMKYRLDIYIRVNGKRLCERVVNSVRAVLKRLGLSISGNPRITKIPYSRKPAYRYVCVTKYVSVLECCPLVPRLQLVGRKMVMRW